MCGWWCAHSVPSPFTSHYQALGRDPRAEGYSGADLAALVREAGVCVLRELRRAGGLSLNTGMADGNVSEAGAGLRDKPLAIGRRHFEEAFSRVPPSVSPKDQRRYLSMRNSLSRARGAGAGGAGAGAGGDAEEAPSSGGGGGGLQS